MAKTRWTDAQMGAQAGRVAVVTGANSGIGLETARALAGKGAEVILAVRSVTKGEAAAEKIRAAAPEARLRVMALDLSSLDSVRAFAATLSAAVPRLDLLILNAGVMIPPYQKTADGFELQIGTNHLGHFALAGLVLPLLVGVPGSRVVVVSSLAHKPGRIAFDDLHWEGRKYKRWQAYAASKMANLLFMYALARRLKAAGAQTIAVAAHPGWTATALQKHTGLGRFFNPLFAQKPPQGAWPTLYAASAPDLENGTFYGPGGWFELRGHPKQVQSVPYARDEALAEKFWALSEELTGVTFDFGATPA